MAVGINALDPNERIKRLEQLGSLAGFTPSQEQAPAPQQPQAPQAPSAPGAPATGPQTSAATRGSGAGGLSLDLAPLIQEYIQLRQTAGDKAAKTAFQDRAKGVIEQFKTSLKAYLQGVMDRDGNGIPDNQEAQGRATQQASMGQRSQLGSSFPRLPSDLAQLTGRPKNPISLT